MHEDLRVGGRLKDRAALHQVLAQGMGVGQIAVVGEGEAARAQFGEQRLHVAQGRLARGRIAHMADRRRALQAADDLLAGEDVADQAQIAVRVKLLSVPGDDARGLLPAVLQCMQAEHAVGGGIVMAENAEHAAFFTQLIVVERIGDQH